VEIRFVLMSVLPHHIMRTSINYKVSFLAQFKIKISVENRGREKRVTP